VGEKKFNEIRRTWDCPIPNGETLKMVYDRAVPYFLTTILTHLLAGENVLIVAHGNSLRALIKYIEQIPDEKMGDIEMPFNTILIYTLDENGHSLGKEIREVK
jgi:2,3-bisphosphoglycerate-dependent phosphoglycerate mutase